MLSRETSEKDLKIVQVEDSGKKYEIEFYTMINSDYNVSNGGKREIQCNRVFKIKANGQRGMQLSGFWSRAWDVIKASI